VLVKRLLVWCTFPLLFLSIAAHPHPPELTRIPPPPPPVAPQPGFVTVQHPNYSGDDVSIPIHLMAFNVQAVHVIVSYGKGLENVQLIPASQPSNWSSGYNVLPMSSAGGEVRFVMIDFSNGGADLDGLLFSIEGRIAGIERIPIRIELADMWNADGEQISPIAAHNSVIKEVRDPLVVDRLRGHVVQWLLDNCAGNVGNEPNLNHGQLQGFTTYKVFPTGADMWAFSSGSMLWHIAELNTRAVVVNPKGNRWCAQ